MALLILLRTIRSARRSHAAPGQDHVRSGPTTTLTRSRRILIGPHGGRWQGSFIRLNGTGHEEETRCFSSGFFLPAGGGALRPDRSNPGEWQQRQDSEHGVQRPARDGFSNGLAHAPGHHQGRRLCYL